ncbi:MAG: hypothetical protein H8K10_14605 [Nitrospira sp.]|nr:hypothetical protein [Nitrospira sp.]
MNALPRIIPIPRHTDYLLLALTVFLVPLMTGVTFKVDSVIDVPDSTPGDHVCDGGGTGGTGICTLRAAVMESNASSGIDTIEVPSGLYRLDPKLGPLEITDETKIQGAGPTSTILDGSSGGLKTLVIYVTQGGYLVANHLTVQNGDTPGGGGIVVEEGSAEFNNIVIRDNTAFSSGGAGLGVRANGRVKMWRSAVLNNTGGAAAGGISNSGELWVFESTIADNKSSHVAGIRNHGEMHLHNTTVSGNESFAGTAGTGGIFQAGSAVLNNVTITKNKGRGNFPSSFSGGGIQNVGTTTLKNSIIADNEGDGGPNDCVGSLNANSKYNLIGDRIGCNIPASTEPTFLFNPKPELGPLANNGGPTQTHLPAPTSPALNAGYRSPIGWSSRDDCEARDQRGVPRRDRSPRVKGYCDVGAVEVTSANFAVVRFVLVDAVSDTDIRPLLQGDTIVLSDLPSELSIRAEIMGSPGGVVFGYDGAISYRTDMTSPYSLGQETGGRYDPFVFTSGRHTLSATPFTVAKGGNLEGGSQTIEFIVQDVPGAFGHGVIDNIHIRKPADNLTLAGAVLLKVDIEKANYSNVLVRTDKGTSAEKNVTGQMVLRGVDALTADLMLPFGTHTITASGEVPCWYCTGGKRQSSVSHTFTLLPSPAPCTRTDGNFVRTIPAAGIAAGQMPGRQVIATPLLNGTDMVMIIIDDAPDLQQNQMRLELDINPDQGVTWNKAIEAWGACHSGSRTDLAEASMAGGFGVGVICSPPATANDFRSGCTIPQTVLLNQSTTGELLLRKPGFWGVWHDVEVFDSSIWPALGGRSVRFIWSKD